MYESKAVIDMKQTGNNIRNYALRYGYSVKDIQHYLGLSCPQPVYRWFNGTILPSVDNLLKLSELFHVHMEDLLVKENSGNVYSYCFDIDADSIQVLNRLQAYCKLFTA